MGDDRWWRRYWRSLGFVAEVAEELDFHVERLAADLTAGGMSPEAARAEALRRFGDRGRVQASLERIERTRRRRIGLGVRLEELWADVRYGVRGLLKRPAFAAAAAASLALGIGAATVVFSIVDTWLLRPLPVPRSEELILVGARYQSLGQLVVPNVAPATLTDLAARKDLFTAVGGWHLQMIATRRPSETQAQITWAIIGTGNYFDVLGIRAALGRTFTESDARARNPVTVIGHDYWRTRFAGDSSVVGQTVLIAGLPFTVVGVLPPGFEGTEPLIQVGAYLPIGVEGLLDPRLAGFETRRDAGFYQGLARRRPDRSVEAVEAGVAVLSRQLAAGYPELPEGYQLVPIPERRARPTISAGGATVLAGLALLVLGALVLGAAAVNVANLVLTRATTRQEEMAVRVALGASRGRLVRQLVTESALLGGLGFAGAVVVARVAIGAIGRITAAGSFPLKLDFALDGRVLGASLVLALLAGVGSGLGPALVASRGAGGAIRRAGRGGLGGQGKRLRSGLVVAQVAASFVTLAAAGLFIRSAGRAAAIDLGFEPGGVVVTQLDLGQARLQVAEGRAMFERIARAIRTVPGIDSVAVATSVPLTPGSDLYSLYQTEARATNRNGALEVLGGAVSPEYFGLMGVPIEAGRAFQPSDDSAAPLVAIVNRRAAEILWPGRDPIGRQFRLAENGPTVEVVGVTPTGRYLLIGEAPRPFVYLAAAQRSYSFGSVLIRSREGARQLEPRIRAAIASVHPDLVPLAYEGMVNLIQDGPNGLLPLKLGARLTAAIGCLALALTVVGLYGVLSYAVSQETREIGVRMALGALPTAIVGRVLGRGGRLVGAGVVLGVVVAAGMTRALGSLLVGVRPVDPVVYGAAAAAMVAVAAAAAYFPARRAARLDPVRALREG